jgi:hypothetical protein
MSAISFVEYEIAEGEVEDFGQLWRQGWGGVITVLELNRTKPGENKHGWDIEKANSKRLKPSLPLLLSTRLGQVAVEFFASAEAKLSLSILRHAQADCDLDHKI